MLFMHTLVTVVIIIVSLFIVGFTYNLLMEAGWVQLDENNPILALLPVLTLSAIASMLISYLLGRTVMRPMRTFQEAFKKVSEGDFDHHIKVVTHVTEIDEMKDGFNKMVDDLASIETLSSDFIANVSHEFKTPLASIEAYAVLLQSEDLDETQKEEYISMIRTSAQDLSILTGNILNLSRVENVEMELNNKQYRLDEQIRNIILMNEESWSKKNIEFDLDMETTLYYGNKNLMSQVFQNLIDNAIKFLHEDSLIIIELKEMNDKILFSITDFGVGISKDDLDKVFDKFYQGDNSRKSYGNGLGLSLVKRISELSDADLMINSNINKGTKVTLWL